LRKKEEKLPREMLRFRQEERKTVVDLVRHAENRSHNAARGFKEQKDVCANISRKMLVHTRIFGVCSVVGVVFFV